MLNNSSNNEINLHSYTVEDQANGKKLDIFISDFVLDVNGNVIISPDQWGPTAVSDDGTETDDSSWDGSGEFLVENQRKERLDLVTREIEKIVLRYRFLIKNHGHCQMGMLGPQ